MAGSDEMIVTTSEPLAPSTVTAGYSLSPTRHRHDLLSGSSSTLVAPAPPTLVSLHPRLASQPGLIALHFAAVHELVKEVLPILSSPDDSDIDRAQLVHWGIVPFLYRTMYSWHGPCAVHIVNNHTSKTKIYEIQKSALLKNQF